MINHFFIYGTLMSGEKRFNHPALIPLRVNIKKGWVNGTELYNFGDFPGMVPSEKHESCVYGEIQEFTSIEKAIKILDRLERYNPTDIKNSLFRREEVKAILFDRTAIRAWAYFYNQSLKGAKKIPSGDWRKRG